MAFMMPVVKNDWDIYNARRGEGEQKGRARKVSECTREVSRPTLSPHRSAPAMRSLSYSSYTAAARPPASRASLRQQPPVEHKKEENFHSRLVEKLKRALGRAETNPRRS